MQCMYLFFQHQIKMNLQIFFTRTMLIVGISKTLNNISNIHNIGLTYNRFLINSNNSLLFNIRLINHNRIISHNTLIIHNRIIRHNSIPIINPLNSQFKDFFLHIQEELYYIVNSNRISLLIIIRTKIMSRTNSKCIKIIIPKIM